LIYELASLIIIVRDILYFSFDISEKCRNGGCLEVIKVPIEFTAISKGYRLPASKIQKVPADFHLKD